MDDSPPRSSKVTKSYDLSASFVPERKAYMGRVGSIRGSVERNSCDADEIGEDIEGRGEDTEERGEVPMGRDDDDAKGGGVGEEVQEGE